MDYKTKIIEMIENMQNEDFLMKIYYFVRVIFAKDAEGAYTLDKANLRKDGQKTDDFLEKGKFALMELMRVTTISRR